MSAYASLVQQFLRIDRIDHASTFLSWDQQVMMPPGGAEGRAQALAELHQIHHSLLTDDRLSDWFQQAAEQSLNLQEQASLREMQRVWRQASCLPADLVQAQSLAASRCEHAWREQRRNNDWQGLLPLFKEVVKLAREEAQARQAAAAGSFATPYDALLDLYASGDSSAFIAELFAGLKAQLPGLINEVIEHQQQAKPVDLSGHYPIPAQEALSRQVMSALGFDFRQGRLDVSSHPFSTGVHGDNRITTRYRENDFVDALLSTLHETGHASYEAGLPAPWCALPVGKARSMSIHESQSLLFEKQLCLSKPFVEFLTPLARQHFPTLQSLNADQLWQSMTRVERGFIRVEADEVTYPMHVILRYEIEAALINGEMAVEEIPEAWQQKMQAYLGLDSGGNDRDGCMQDIHWPSGAFGYFPSYTLGALNAAQLFAALRRELPDLDDSLRQGDIAPLRQWLGEKIWSKGSFLSSQALMTEASGEPTNPAHFIRHIRQRYLGA